MTSRCNFSNAIFPRCSVQKIMRSVRVNTYRSQVTVTSLKASEYIVVKSRLNSSLNTREKRNTQQGALEIVNFNPSYK